MRKVNYTVDPTRVGNRNDYERLAIEVTTNGTIDPTDALTRAALGTPLYLALRGRR